MAIKLFNHTAYDDRLLKRLLTFAARVVGVKDEVVVKVTAARKSPSGVFYRGFPFYYFLRKRMSNIPLSWRRLVGKKSGWVCIRITSPDNIQEGHHWRNDMSAAFCFLETAAHEMAHVLQHRGGLAFAERRTASGRRIAHDRRPIELDADNRADEALDRQRHRADELAFELAMHIYNLKNRSGS